MSYLKYFLISFVFVFLLSCGKDNSKISVNKVEAMESLRAKEDYVVAKTVEGNRMLILFRKGYVGPDTYVVKQKDGIRQIWMAMDDGVRPKSTMVFMDVNCQTKEYRLKRDSEWEKVTASRSLVAYGVAYACELPALEQ